MVWPMDTTRYLRVAGSGEMLDRSGRLMYAFLNDQDQWCFARDLDELGPRVVQATLAVEDRRFYRHPGVDSVAIVRAAWQNLESRRIVSGGSTITMQVIKNGDDRGRARSVTGKLRQAIQAVRLEARSSKEAILRAYLNTAPYGLNLVGAEAAARRYFGKPARELTLAEAALVAALPKAPTTLMPLRYPDRARQRRNYALDRMRVAGFIRADECRLAKREPLGVRWAAFPESAPHLAMRLKPLIVRQGRVRLTLDADVQQAAEHLVDRSLNRYRGDISNAAVMVVDAPSASVLAWVGSGDFFGTPGGGQVDLCRAARSPGSALKPFTYALAMENNLVYPSETLLDDSLDLGAYSPENYDEGYNGLISATDALRHSLNIPAVMVLGRLGVERLHDFLNETGLTTLKRSSEDYGLGLTLGNCEVQLDEMSAAYCMLANLGEYRLLQTRMDEPAPDGKSCLSRGTCIKLFEMLERTLPEEFDDHLVRAAGLAPRVCCKTGTSTGHHDAWAFVFNRQYVVGVWMGNNNGKPSNRLVGAYAALPLAGKVFRALRPTNAPAWPDAGNDLHAVRVCAVSGLPASRWCLRTREVMLPRNQYLHRTCDVHYPMRGGAGTDAQAAERWPGAAKGWDLANISAPVAPERRPGGSAHARQETLRIQEPADHGEYVLTGEANGDRVKLRTSLDAEAALHWYLDDLYLGTSTPQAPLLVDLKTGDHALACMTTEGALDCVRFTVTEPSGPPRFPVQ
jgi:penicillin-binding protein 1C